MDNVHNPPPNRPRTQLGWTAELWIKSSLEQERAYVTYVRTYVRCTLSAWELQLTRQMLTDGRTYAHTTCEGEG